MATALLLTIVNNGYDFNSSCTLGGLGKDIYSMMFSFEKKDVL